MVKRNGDAEGLCKSLLPQGHILTSVQDREGPSNYRLLIHRYGTSDWFRCITYKTYDL